MIDMFKDLNTEQQLAIAIYGIKSGTVGLHIRTGHGRAAEIVDILNDFCGSVQKNRELAEIWDKVREL